MGTNDEFVTTIGSKTIGAIVNLINALYKDVKSITVGENTILLVTKNDVVYSFWITELIDSLVYVLNKSGEKT